MAEDQISWPECLAVGVAGFGLVGMGTCLALLAGIVAYVRDDADFWNDLSAPVFLSGLAAASITGALAWRVGVRTKDAPRWKGACAGAFVGVASHPLCWVFLSSYAVATDRALWNPAAAASFIFMGTVLASFSSLLGLGWVTTPLGALLGALVVESRAGARRKSRASAWSGHSPPG